MVTWLTRSLLFIVAGAVLAYAVTVQNKTIDVQTTGVILLLVGIFDLLLNFGMSMYERRPALMHNPYPPQAPPLPPAQNVARPAAVRATYPEVQDASLHTTQPLQPIRPDNPDWR
jgi:hypothetical protein